LNRVVLIFHTQENRRGVEKRSGEEERRGEKRREEVCYVLLLLQISDP
jgi:hypothetical protein